MNVSNHLIKLIEMVYHVEEDDVTTHFFEFEIPDEASSATFLVCINSDFFNVAGNQLRLRLTRKTPADGDFAVQTNALASATVSGTIDASQNTIGHSSTFRWAVTGDGDEALVFLRIKIFSR